MRTLAVLPDTVIKGELAETEFIIERMPTTFTMASLDEASKIKIKNINWEVLNIIKPARLKEEAGLYIWLFRNYIAKDYKAKCEIKLYGLESHKKWTTTKHYLALLDPNGANNLQIYVNLTEITDKELAYYDDNDRDLIFKEAIPMTLCPIADEINQLVAIPGEKTLEIFNY